MKRRLLPFEYTLTLTLAPATNVFVPRGNARRTSASRTPPSSRFHRPCRQLATAIEGMWMLFGRRFAACVLAAALACLTPAAQAQTDPSFLLTATSYGLTGLRIDEKGLSEAYRAILPDACKSLTLHNIEFRAGITRSW
jgi:hypothetical protein